MTEVAQAQANGLLRGLLRRRSVWVGAAFIVVCFAIYQFGFLPPIVVWLMRFMGMIEPASSLPPPRGIEGQIGLSESYELQPRRIDLLPSGTAMKQLSAHGFPHIIIRVQPHIDSGDVDRLPAMAIQACQQLFFVVAAGTMERQDASGRARYELARVALGIGGCIEEEELIVSGSSSKNPASKLGLVGSIFLRISEERAKATRVTLSSSNMVIVDIPIFLARDGQHKPGCRRVAVLVSKETGKVETVFWFIEKTTNDSRSVVGAIHCLPPGRVEDCKIHVDAKYFSLRLPTERALAMASFPKGNQEILMPEDKKGLLGKDQYTEESAGELEKLLRELLGNAESVPAHVP